jgi:D-glycero-D-manno-heptose 1,7-bisphosphate phosphatase
MRPWRHLPERSRFLSDASGLPAARRGVFLDRDSVIVEDVHFLATVERLRVLPGAAEALRRLQQRFYLVVVTNQSGIARGLLTEDDLFGIHAELVRRLAAEGVVIDAFYYCPHLPEATVPGYGGECDCRKPKPGMLLRAAQDWDIDLAHSFMVGDMPRDVEAGRAAGVRSILLRDAEPASDGIQDTARDLAHAAQIILDDSTREGALNG